MSRPGSLLWRALRTVLWFLARLLVLALTGSWIARPDDEEEARAALDEEMLDPKTGLPAWQTEAQARALSSVEPADARDWLASLEDRVEAARTSAASMRQPGNLVHAVDALEEEVEACRSHLQGAGPALLSRLQHLELALGYLERSLEQRGSEPEVQSWLAAVDRLADDLVAPVTELLDSHGARRPRRIWLSSHGRLGEAQQQALVPTPLGALSVERSLANQPEGWPVLAPRVARSLLFDVPGLSEELHRRHRLPVAVTLPHSHEGIGPDEVQGALGPWLETLFADIYATLRLGPAYAHFLRRVLDEGGPSQRAHAATAHGPWLSPLPPRSLRIHAARRVLDVLGQHREAASMWEAWTQRHGEVETFFFPTADGTWNAIPADYVFAELEPLLESLTTEPLDSLGQSAMVDVPDLELGHADEAIQERQRALFAQGRHERHAPYLALAAAARAVDEDGADPEVVARSARRALGVPEAPAGWAPARARSPEVARASEPRSLAAAVRSRRVQREAIALGAALGKRRAWRPGRRRGQAGPA